MIRLAICDDDRSFLENLRKTLLSCEAIPPGTSVHPFSSGEELMDSYLKQQRYAVIFLDIEMPGLSGLETGQRIRGMDKDAIIAFLTNYRQYVFQSFMIEPFDYLVKPVNAAAVNGLLTRVVKKYREQHHVVTLKWQDIHHALDVGEVVCVEGYHRHTVFFTEKEKYECVGQLDEYETLLAPYGFLRCHQGFLINMKYIKSIEISQIITVTGQKVDMSQRKKQQCLKSFNAYIARYRI